MENEPHVMFRKGTNVYLRPLSEDDLPFLLEHINNEETQLFLGVNQPITMYQEKEWLKRNGEDRSTITFGIVLLRTHELIGTIDLHEIDYISRTAEIACAIHRDHLSEGYGSEAGELLLEYAFKTLNLRKLNATAFAFNERSIALQLKGGFKQEGCLIKQVYRDGTYHDMLLFGCLKDDYLREK